MSKSKHEFTLNAGTSSILFIFVILCLVSFAILSLSSAASDYKLSQRVLTNTESYYNACNSAEELLDSFDRTLSDLYETGISRTGYYEKVGRKKAFAIPVNETQTLEVEISILFPDEPGSPFYEITSWKTELTANLEYDDSLPVFQKSE